MDKTPGSVGWEATGLSFVEIGGVTMLEQEGILNLACSGPRMLKHS